ncbi:hypothetical protein [Nocardia anaemiae]|uniref:hypothetical protein n=1 Tax=Nocardia anaemiae TaxID=263910 RepID=UPI0007A445CE|nr:hypothetical protein [Nocardia anaemiae]
MRIGTDKESIARTDGILDYVLIRGILDIGKVAFSDDPTIRNVAAGDWGIGLSDVVAELANLVRAQPMSTLAWFRWQSEMVA